MTTVATICARGGSVGVPGKNIKLLHGKPLIAYTIAQALACAEIDHVYVSTDDEEIAEVAKSFGAEVPFLRPAALATSRAAKIPVIQHLIKYIESQGVVVNKIVDLDPTSPLRVEQDIKDCLNMLDDLCDVVITGYESDKNPYFNMVERLDSGYMELVCQAPDKVVARQQAPQVYAMNASIYVWHRHTLSKGLWDGNVKIHVMPHERSIDIDAPIDFKFVELLMAERKNR